MFLLVYKLKAIHGKKICFLKWIDKGLLYILREIIICATATTQMITKINPQADEKGPN